MVSVREAAKNASSPSTNSSNRRKKQVVIPRASCSDANVELCRQVANEILTTMKELNPQEVDNNVPPPEVEIVPFSTIRLEGIKPLLKFSNVVATWNIGRGINLKKIAFLHRMELPTKFNQKRFAAMRITIFSEGQPPTAVLVFANGNVVHTGGRSEWHTRGDAWKACALLNRIGIPAFVNYFCIQNIVCTFHFGHPVDCFALKEKMKMRAQFNPKKIQCCFIRDPTPGRQNEVKLLFLPGGTVLTGMKTREQIERAFREAYELGESVGHGYGNDSKTGYRFSKQREMSTDEKLLGVNKKISKMSKARALGKASRQVVNMSLIERLTKKDKTIVPFHGPVDTTQQIADQPAFSMVQQYRPPPTLNIDEDTDDITLI